jgi:alanyl-tRNA synthetase
MSDKKSYYSNSYLKTLETHLESTIEDDRGIWYAYDKTIFYPEGGGQTSDQGWINDITVNDVKSSNGLVWHLLDEKPGDQVKMKLDWQHRYANMQQHTGQHILSACFKQLHNLDTVSVHLGSDMTLIELDTPNVDDRIIEETELLANKMIRDHLPVQSVWIKKNEIQQYNLRRQIKSSEQDIRLIQIGNNDTVGCGGLHVSSTAEVGLIKITGLEKIRKHTRLKIKVGFQAYRYLDELHNSLQRVNNYLSTSAEDLPQRVETLVQENKNYSRDLKKANELWLNEYAKNLPTPDLEGCFYLHSFTRDQLILLSAGWVELHRLPCLFLSYYDDLIIFCIRFPENIGPGARDFIQRYRKKFILNGGGGHDFGIGEIKTKGVDTEFRQKLFTAFLNFRKERSQK